VAENQPVAPPAQAEPEAPAGKTYTNEFDRLKAKPIISMRKIFKGEDIDFNAYDGSKIALNINMLNAVMPKEFRYAEKDEVCTFVHYCAANRLDPFRKQVYFIKYSQSAPAAFVTSWTVFVDRANRNPQFDGFVSGIVWHIKKGDEIEVVRGRPCDYVPDDTHIIAGGWARGYRKDQKYPREVEIPLSEMQARRMDKSTGKTVPTKMWAESETTMCTKTPSARVLRLLFPDELGTLFTAEEQRDIPKPDTEPFKNFGDFLGEGKEGADGGVKTSPESAAAPAAPKPVQGRRRRFGPPK